MAGPELLDAIDAAAGEMGRMARIHLKVDSGMHRYGAAPADVLALVDRMAGLESVELAGVSTHYAAADETEHVANARQAAIFEQVAAQIRVRIGHPFALHAANSAATLRGMAAGTDIARCGIAIYGLAPSPQVGLAAGMRPSLSLMSRLGRVHAWQGRDGIGYGHTYVCEAEEWFGLIPLGYADGYRRALSNRSWVCIAGQRCPGSRQCQHGPDGSRWSGRQHVGPQIWLASPDHFPAGRASRNWPSCGIRFRTRW